MDLPDNLRFLGHEFKTPLNSILGFSHLLMTDAALSEEARRRAQIIHNCGNHLLALVEGILSCHRVADGRSVMAGAPAAPATVLDEVLASLQPQAMAKGLGLSRDVVPLVDGFIAEAVVLRQILLNLIGNAIRCTAEGGVLVCMTPYELGVADRIGVEVVVRDTGCGLDPARLETLFATAGPMEEADGHGLGLWISRSLTLNLGGDLDVASQPGMGSVFRLRLPVQRVAGEPPVAPVSLVTGQTTLAGRRFLVVDDDQANQLLVASLLKRHQAQVVLSGDGLTAVKLMAQARGESLPYDAVLLDIRMPVLDGFGTLARLRREGYEGPVLALTADATEADEGRFSARGFDGLVPKPVRAERLWRILAANGIGGG